MIGETASAAVDKGVVRIKLPGGKGFVALTDVKSIPLGATIDTTKGQVELTMAADSAGKTQVGHISQGQFILRQSPRSALTTLQLSGGGLSTCKTKLPHGGAPKQASAARRSRRLFASVKGRFRTRGRNSSATVRGTKWLQKDTCSGTLTKVTQGAVMVRDFRLRKNKLIKAGHSYFARSVALKKRRRR